MVTFVDVFRNLDQMGLTDALVPFILIFAIVYGILEMVKIFGKDGKNINIIVAFSMAALVVVPHITGSYPPGADVVEIINSSIPAVTGVIIAIVMMLILIGAFGGKMNIAGKSVGGFVALAAAVIVIGIFGTNAGWFGGRNAPGWLSFLYDSDLMATIVVLLIFGLIVWFITGDKSAEEKAKDKDKKNAIAGLLEALGSSVEKSE